MGFFDRFAKSLLGKKEADVAPARENTSRTTSPPSFHPSPIRAVPTAPKVHHEFVESSTSISSTAAAVAELPEIVDDLSDSIGSDGDGPEAGFFDVDFDQDLDDVFAALTSGEAASGTTSTPSTIEEMTSEDQTIVEDLFADIAANYARPVKNFIFELKRGTATRDWIDICRPAMQGITRAAEGMGLRAAAQRMVDFEAALSLAQGSENRILGGEIRDLLLLCYEDLIKIMPQAFVVGEEEQQREGIILNSLLMQIPDVGRVTVEKLYRAGLTSLDTLFLAKRDDLAVATGIPAVLSERICEKFQAYRAGLQSSPRDAADVGQRARLSVMIADLRRNHEGFQHASDHEWSNPELAAEKRDYRQQRQSCVLWINVLLAEVGELELVNELQKLSFERRIERLEEYLASPSTTI